MTRKYLATGVDFMAKHPYSAFRFLASIVKGFCFKIIYSIPLSPGKRVRIGRRFRVQGRLIIRGPGKVVIGDLVTCGERVTPWTTTKNAEIYIGNGVFLNGTRFGCHTRIEVGDGCVLADCRIMDTDFHNVHPDKRNDPGFVKAQAIKIGKNVWITVGCVILKGVTIGDNSTVTPNSVVFESIPDNSIYGGNPAKLIRRL